MWRFGLTCTLWLVVGSPLWAQVSAWQFQWQQGQILQYKVEHNTSAGETVDDKTSETKTRLNLTKRWSVMQVDPQGIATLQLQLSALRLETTTPSGKVMLFDSATPETSDPQLKEQLTKYLNGSLAVIRIDKTGKVVEVRESKYGPAAAFETTPPFMVVLPAAVPGTNQYWDRPFTITLDPPQGTGEKYEAVQRYLCKQATNTLATLGVGTSMKTQPSTVADQLPLLQLQPEGEIVFNWAEGRLQSGILRINKEVKGHQGEKSVYRFQSTYTEEFIGR